MPLSVLITFFCDSDSRLLQSHRQAVRFCAGLILMLMCINVPVVIMELTNWPDNPVIQHYLELFALTVVSLFFGSYLYALVFEQLHQRLVSFVGEGWGLLLSALIITFTAIAILLFGHWSLIFATYGWLVTSALMLLTTIVRWGLLPLWPLPKNA